MSRTRIGDLSDIIQSHVRIIDSWHKAEGLPSPSFEIDYPENLPKEIQDARTAVLVATDELSDLMKGAHDLATGLPPRHTSMVGIQAVNRWNVAEHLPRNAELSYEVLAHKCNVPEAVFIPILRQAISQHVFKESQPGFVAHTAASRALLEGTGIKSFVSIATDDMWPSAAHMLDAMEKWNHSQASNHAGFNLAKNTDVSYLESMETNEKRRKAFADTMSYMQSRNGVFAASNHLLTTFDWNPIGKIVDIGGGQGDTAIAIAESSMNTVCVVQDLPDVVALAEKKIPANMKSRIELTAHDFFEEQPVKDADVFFLRWILHDWSDENAIRIIRALIPALRPETQVVLQEFIVPESRTVPFYFEKTVRCMDIAIRASLNAKERSIDDWTHLFAKADAGFELTNVQAGGAEGLAMMCFRLK